MTDPAVMEAARRILQSWAPPNIFGCVAAELLAAEEDNARLREALSALANAADDVGVKYFDTDTMEPLVEVMQTATLAARAALAKAGKEGI